MNSKERLKTILSHEEPDKVPSFELSIDNLSICQHFSEDYVFQGLVKSFAETHELCKGNSELLTSTILKATETRSYIKNTLKKHVELYKKIGIDLAIVPFTGYVLFPEICGKDYFVDEFGRIFDLKRNPNDMMDIAYYKDGYFTTFEDYEAFKPPEPESERRIKYFDYMKKIEAQNEDSISIIPSIWGIFEPVWQAFGFVNFSKLLSNQKQIRKLFDDRGKFALELVKIFIEKGEDLGILIYDDYGYKSGLLMNPKKFKEYVLPWLKKICDFANKKGVRIILHSCGDIYPIFDDIVKTGIDAIHPVEPTTANPLYDIFQLYEKYKNEITFIGNVSPQDLADKDPQYIEDYTQKLIKHLAPGGGFILSSGHSINPSVKLGNYLKMHETLKKYGNYPINH
ncbi:MAG: hypothetical protein GF317_21945 [Candidatus Lokiarchaeota archaeon]|nr:hypothetical protein [Candidatus Lokiarchaeota archaeon]MBD3202122.1 hypothetical protein [Candidatus Lokiarchaeota archaeon]